MTFGRPGPPGPRGPAGGGGGAAGADGADGADATFQAATVDLGTYTIDNNSSLGDIVDLGPGAHILLDTIEVCTALDFDNGAPSGDTYLTADVITSIDGVRWQLNSGANSDTGDDDWLVVTAGSLTGPFEAGDVLPRTIHAGPLVVGRYVRLKIDWGTDIGPDASATFSVTAKSVTPVAGPPDDWISVYNFASGQEILALNANTFVEFDTGDDPAPRGTALTWDDGTPSVVQVNETGIYDVSGKLIVADTDPEEPGKISLAEIHWNNDNSGPGYTHDLYGLGVAPNSDFLVMYFVIPGMAIEAGQTLRLLVIRDNSLGEMYVSEAALTVSRRG